MLPNISQLNDYIWTGGDLHPAYINATKQMTHITDEGISVIIDTRYEWNDESLWAEHPDVDYHHLGVDDDGGVQPDWWWGDGLAIIHRAIRDDRQVLIHCHMGVNRGPSLAGIALVDAFRQSPLAAWSTIRAKRPISWACYMPDGLHYLGRHREAQILQTVIDGANENGEMDRTIGVIRKLHKDGLEASPAAIMAALGG